MALLKSRKFQLTLTSVLSLIAAAYNGAIEPAAAAYGGIILVLGLIVSIAIEDASKRGGIFDKAQELVEQAAWLMSEAGELMTRVEEQSKLIEKDE